MVAIEVHIPLLLLTQTLRTTEAIYTKPVLWPEDLFPDEYTYHAYSCEWFFREVGPRTDVLCSQGHDKVRQCLAVGSEFRLYVKSAYGKT